ncbi:hypothetical protein F8154_07840 [Alkaliphilus pronyensis]|uniref:Copper amine oxidase-like N-terminal domain-containing protein n=1 Tax=Alkaliphilus pronyensis TaxID=1482732 RepID=A0A6I0F8C9_9FIRM|nr:stalk domain-containing protein [Alkaliphilus pronyensis]KAB3534764.1 hypothetical protein F8154_07840 [Alkaliphilus pronyensis]
MNRNLKLSILLIFIVSVIFTGIAYASDTLNIQVLFNYMNITINGEKVNMDNFVYNDTTYVPLRKVAELFDKEVMWYDKTKTINIMDKKIKVDGFYTKCDNIKTALITNANENILRLEFQLKNTASEDITITLHYPYFDFIIYDENECEIYKYSNEYGDSATLIRNEKIRSGKEFTTNCKIDLNHKEFIGDKIYKVVFFASFEMKSENKKYKLYEEAYFRTPTIHQTE